jgi:hypothetical protein
MTTQLDDLEGLLAGLAEHAPGGATRETVERRVAARRRRRGTVRLGAALACAALVVGGIVMIQARSQPDGRAADQPGSAYSFSTPTVALTADRIAVTVAGRTSSPASATVHSDPGQPNQYTTLELTWTDGVEQRLNIYFASDGTNWWASEIRVYDSSGAGGWVEPSATGEFFKSPLGTAYHGNFQIANVDITNLTLQAFLTPAECNPTGHGIALISLFGSISEPSGGDFTAGFRLVDIATCAVVSPGSYSIAYTTDDEAIASTFVDIQPADGILRVNVHPHAVGTTTLHATVKDATGNVVAIASVPVVVTP